MKVQVKFEAKFAKDLRAIRDQKLLNKVKEIIDDCKSAHTLSEINHIKLCKVMSVFIVFV